MISISLLSVLVVVLFVVLCYTFNNSKIELESPTIAAMEAHAEIAAAGMGTAELDMEEEPVYETEEEPEIYEEEESPMEPEEESVVEAEPEDEIELEDEEIVEEEEEPAAIPYEEEVVDELEEEETSAPPPPLQVTDYEYRVMLEEGGENYVLPQWMLNFFSSSDICHTLDPSDNMVIIVKLNNARNEESGDIVLSADCDMSTQTVALKISFGEGVEAETFKTKFYLFERGDLFELGRLVRQDDIRIDMLTRGADYTLEYSQTLYCGLPRILIEKIKDVLSKIPA